MRVRFSFPNPIGGDSQATIRHAHAETRAADPHLVEDFFELMRKSSLLLTLLRSWVRSGFVPSILYFADKMGHAGSRGDNWGHLCRTCSRSGMTKPPVKSVMANATLARKPGEGRVRVRSG